MKDKNDSTESNVIDLFPEKRRKRDRSDSNIPVQKNMTSDTFPTSASKVQTPSQMSENKKPDLQRVQSAKKPVSPVEKPENPASESEEASKVKPPLFASFSHRLVASILTVLLVFGALVLFLYRDKLTGDAIRAAFGSTSSVSQEEAPFTYESGTMQAFAPAKNGLAVASRTGLHIFDGKGNSIGRHIFPMRTPAVATSKIHCAFYDIGGTALRIADYTGECIRLDPPNPIISVTMNANGWLAVTTEKAGMKGSVTVYDADLNKVYVWESGLSGYCLSAQIAPDNSGMSVLSTDSSGGKITFLDFSSDEATAAFVAPGELILDFSYTSVDRLCAISEQRIFFFSSRGEIIGEKEFGEMHLTNYDIRNPNFASIHLSKYRSGNAGVLITLDDSGTVLGSLELYRDLVSLSSYGKNLAVLYSDGLCLYSHSLNLVREGAPIVGVKKILLRNSNEALLLTAYAAEIYKF